MHGLVNRSIQSFLTQTHGAAAWARIAEASQVPPGGFEPLSVYDDGLTHAVLRAAGDQLARPPAMLLEDVGTFVVAHPGSSAVRRLLRYGGGEFADFLYSLEELPERARLAVPDLGLPMISVSDAGSAGTQITFSGGPAGTGPFFLGVLRAMADEYGVLALLSLDDGAGHARIRVEIADRAFAQGRAFALAAG